MSAVHSRLAEVARDRLSHEYTDSVLYERLAATVGEASPFSEILKILSATEKKHFEFWERYAPGTTPKLDRLKATFPELWR